MTHRERILNVMRGEMVDVIPFVPRLDLWWLGNATRGTLPEEFAGMQPDDVSRAEGWPVYHMVPAFADVRSMDDVLHRSIGLFNFRQSVYGWRFSPDIEVNVVDKDGQQIVEYHTPLGMVRTVGGLTEEMKKAGASLGWVQEHIIKKPEDYRIVGYLFENIEVFPQYDGALEYIRQVGDDGVAAAGGPTLGASPMHMIQKDLIDTTRFYYEYRDNYHLVRSLAECIEVYFDKVLAIIADSPAEVVLWGANYDDMITYPPYFEKEILPWLRKASEVLGGRGKIMATHTDGENLGLMDLIRDCGAHVAESVTPYPMTRVRIEEYYSRWRDNLTIMGGIPESVLLKETTTDEEFEVYLTNLFRTVSPGDRLILGTADSTPPDAVFDRLRRIHERVEKEGGLPLKGWAHAVAGQSFKKQALVEEIMDQDAFGQVRDLLIAGDDDALPARVKVLLEQGIAANDILHKGLVTGMMHISELFKSGEVFIPEVLLAARAMNEALAVLEPHLAEGDRQKNRKVLIGTVQGDMHDIGKNIVAIMLKGAGFEVRDLGVNVASDEFVRQAQDYRPDILALSALLTTTMPAMKSVIDLLDEKNLRGTLKVMVGGAPLNQRFASDIGADAYAKDAGEAVTAAKELLGMA
ncbi:MAG TPA: cobalamin-dependent protein [Deltaproteobacteria bacterium]|nr:cobalamin-dependent protein [Deltaproteobacteria bacterium]